MSLFADPKKLYFFFDFISHNAYLTWTRMPRLAQKYGLELEPVPVLFAGLLGALGQKGPAEVPPKLRWMSWNVIRKAKLHNVALAPPHSHPFNPLAPLRACCAVEGADRVKLVERLWLAAWAEGKEVSNPQVVAQEIAAAGLDTATVAAAAQTESVKARLRENTDAALRAGVFGVPTMLARGELFWGFDDLDFLDRFLAGNDPLGADKMAFAGWFQVKPSARRQT